MLIVGWNQFKIYDSLKWIDLTPSQLSKIQNSNLIFNIKTYDPTGWGTKFSPQEGAFLFTAAHNYNTYNKSIPSLPAASVFCPIAYYDKTNNRFVMLRDNVNDNNTILYYGKNLYDDDIDSGSDIKYHSPEFIDKILVSNKYNSQQIDFLNYLNQRRYLQCTGTK